MLYSGVYVLYSGPIFYILAFNLCILVQFCNIFLLLYFPKVTNMHSILMHM